MSKELEPTRIRNQKELEKYFIERKETTVSLKLFSSKGSKLEISSEINACDNKVPINRIAICGATGLRRADPHILTEMLRCFEGVGTLESLFIKSLLCDKNSIDEIVTMIRRNASIHSVFFKSSNISCADFASFVDAIYRSNITTVEISSVDFSRVQSKERLFINLFVEIIKNQKIRILDISRNDFQDGKFIENIIDALRTRSAENPIHLVISENKLLDCGTKFREELDSLHSSGVSVDYTQLSKIAESNKKRAQKQRSTDSISPPKEQGACVIAREVKKADGRKKVVQRKRVHEGGGDAGSCPPTLSNGVNKKIDVVDMVTLAFSSQAPMEVESRILPPPAVSLGPEDYLPYQTHPYSADSSGFYNDTPPTSVVLGEGIATHRARPSHAPWL